MLRTTAPPAWLGIVVAATLIAVESLVVGLLRTVSAHESFGMLYLFGVLVVSALWGLGLATMMSLASAVALDYFRDGHLGPFDLENGVVVAVFLVVALVTNFVAGLARTRALEADQRRAETHRAHLMVQASHDRLMVLAEHQAALRRVATVVARGARPARVFAAVADEMARCLAVENAWVLRYESNGDATFVGVHYRPGLLTMPVVGERLPLEGDNVAAKLLQTGRTARIDDYENAVGPVAARILGSGITSVAGAPIVVDARVWGAAIVGSRRREPLPPDTEARVSDFADLVATALANAATRDELIASRARIVAAADEARRRLERDLHDGAQQRLVALGLDVRTAEAAVPDELAGLKQQFSRIVSSLTGVLEDLQEISRGIHPAVLSNGGLGPALKTLARRSAVPVTLDVAIDRRLPASVEVAAYYVVAEALTNTAKHAQAEQVSVSARADDANLRIIIEDDGIGGADIRKGSGLVGLRDRVEAFGGTLTLASQPGSGTVLRVEIPLVTG
ncbi:GAF domain-containing protein [Mycobacterium sp.]|jgi:signal transduction histidine kinase|uniref:sensor histidine kinase n=1 Tax=Mycobacterium sp. TaxID=1785 RepID=UPI002D712D99|nr:GAF domain-containing protein [Mycobacterium sp.]HZA09696.1 GAF domain-containing protein [Mycobacterium sp.]